ncbi:hypothetical protein DFQ28_006021 [Apophysomyces sp. BC1034]|nr:hypothetical protein DFQ30_008312 [Apophysomyces sp. BC1015]KAG0181794.1 hypothetical protein DFQ29_007021 [Apophysomyces sp. BC1021]KAG0193239.1 hypothetical protein DFQ28_006021 [Apophysomyces sp. BC1034]
MSAEFVNTDVNFTYISIGIGLAAVLTIFVIVMLVYYIQQKKRRNAEEDVVGRTNVVEQKPTDIEQPSPSPSFNSCSLLLATDTLVGKQHGRVKKKSRSSRKSSWSIAAASLRRKSVASLQWVGFDGSMDVQPQSRLLVVNGTDTIKGRRSMIK